MKKKILAISLIIAMLAIAVVSGTLAYFTDTDAEDNVFALGNVQIELVEKQRTEDGTALEDFEDDKVLLPIVGSAQGEKDQFGLPTAANYLDKIITVDNTGASDAYVRVLVAFPAGMDADSASDMPLHWNAGNKYFAEGGKTDTDAVNTDFDNWTATLAESNVEINGVTSNIYCFTYEAPLAAGAETASACLTGFYLDSRVDYDADRGVYTMGDRDLSGIVDGKVSIPVFAQAVQVAGFDTATDAFTAAALTTNPWA